MGNGRTPSRAVPWSELPPPAKTGVLFVIVGAGMVFVSACVALSSWLLHIGNVL